MTVTVSKPNPGEICFHIEGRDPVLVDAGLPAYSALHAIREEVAAAFAAAAASPAAPPAAPETQPGPVEPA